MISTYFNKKEILHIFSLFFDDLPSNIKVINTSRGNQDFRETIIGEWKSGEKYVIKLSDNDFTFPDKIQMWKKCAQEYRNCGYYCPEILCSKNGDFPTIEYKKHNCVVYAEEYCKYKVAKDRKDKSPEVSKISDAKIKEEAFLMTAKIAAKRLDFADYPSTYCLFDTFCPTDETDEVMQNALEWKKYAQTLPFEFQTQIQRIWKRWNDNRKELEKIYRKLPTSIFQADLNMTNILLDDNENFAGIFDFNLCGKDVFLNYLFREIYFYGNANEELDYILKILKSVSQIYSFSDVEKQAAPLLYRCLKPLWFTKVQQLKDAGKDRKAIKTCLEATEEMQTKVIDFDLYMK